MNSGLRAADYICLVEEAGFEDVKVYPFKIPLGIAPTSVSGSPFIVMLTTNRSLGKQSQNEKVQPSLLISLWRWDVLLMRKQL